MTSHQNHLQPLNGNKIKKAILIIALTTTVCGCTTTRNIYIPHHKPEVSSTKQHESTEPNYDLKPKKKESKPTEITHHKKKTAKTVKHDSNIQLLLPFNADKINTTQSNDPNIFKDSNIAIEFYRGFKMGLESYDKNIDINIKAFDTQEQSKKIQSILNPRELKDVKLIVGPLFPSEIDYAMQYLSNTKASAYLISPLASKAPHNIEYKNFIMINPPIFIHAEKLASFTISKYKPKHIYYISIQDDSENDKAEEETFLYTFINHILTNSPNTIIQNIAIKKDDIEENIEILNKTFNTREENILLMPYNHINDWYIIMRSLNAINPEIKLTTIAHPSLIKFYRKLDTVKLQQYNTYLSSASFIDTNQEPIVNFFNKYKDTYHAIATKYALSGYDIGLYVANIVQVQGYDNITNYKYQGLLNSINLANFENILVNQSVKILNITTEGPTVYKSY